MAYIRYGEIANEVKQYYFRTGEHISFRHAALKLYHAGKYEEQYEEQIRELPDFMQWDMKNPEELRGIFSKVKIQIDSLLAPDEKGSKKHEMFSERIMGATRNVTTLIHTNYELKQMQSHDFFEVDYVLKGRCRFQFENEKMDLNKGELCIIAPHAPHSLEIENDALVLGINIKKSTFEGTFFHLLSENNILSAFFRNVLYDRKINYLLFAMEDSMYMCELIRHIFQESNSENKYATRVCENYIEIFFSEILRCYSKTFMYHDLNANSQHAKMIAILEYIKNNHTHLSLDELAGFAGYDKAYLGKIIKKYTGLYYNDIINQYKMEQAKKYLESTAYSIEKIAEQLGISSATYFATLFKKAFPLSPKQYRNISQNTKVDVLK